MAHRFMLTQSMGMFAPWLDGLQADHLCHNRACVNPQHLRPVTNKQNHENRSGATKDSKSGVRGVIWDKRRNKWRAQAWNDGKQIYGGWFDTIREADMAATGLRNQLYTHNDLDR